MPGDPLELPKGAEKAIEGWLERLPRLAEGDGLPDEVREGYHALAGLVLLYGLDLEGPEESDPALEDAFAPVLAELAAATRRAGLTISDLLQDLGSLTPTAVAWLEGEGVSTERTRDLLRTTVRVVGVLHAVKRRLVRVLEASAARAEREHAEALMAMTEMLSHELKNRLGAARTASQMLLSPDLALGQEGVERAAELVRSSVDAALRTVDDVRALTAWRSPLTRSGSPSTLPLPGLLGAIVERLRSPAQEVGVEVRIEGEVPDLKVDAARFRLIVYNLVWNGIKYHDPGKERPTVCVEVGVVEDGRIQVRVGDNGLGIAPEELGDIFSYSMRGSGSDGVPGSGLGLAITREAVDQLGGEIEVESEPGVGSTFTLRIPPAPGDGAS